MPTPDTIMQQALAEFEAAHGTDHQQDDVSRERMAALFFDAFVRVVHPQSDKEHTSLPLGAAQGLAEKVEAFVKTHAQRWRAQVQDVASQVRSATGTAARATYTRAGAAVERAEKAATNLAAQAVHGVEVRCARAGVGCMRLMV